MKNDLRANKEETSVFNNDGVKNIIAVILLFILFQSGEILQAQTVQKGLVQEYNEKARKTPLGGVELNVRSAGSTVSDKKGNFSLEFLTLKPGEKVNVRRIEKLGYEIFNKEAIEQWNLNPKNPFVIVMCRSDRFKRIRDNYERVSSESYARQLKKEEAVLAKLKNEGKLKEVEYQKQLFSLRESYEKQLDNLENYVDRFSRIDLSELNATEQEIIGLVQQGRIDEAIAKYEGQNYVDKYAQEVAQIKEVSTAIDRLENVKATKETVIDSILASINRQIETLKIAGGKENLNKIGVIIHDIYLTDTLSCVNIRRYADYLYDINDFINALPLYDKLKNSKNINDIAHASNRLIIINIDLEQYEAAIQESDFYGDLVSSNRTDFSADDMIGFYLNRGSIYYKSGEINKAKIYYSEALTIGEKDGSPLNIANARNSLSNILCSEHRYDEALNLYLENLDVYRQYYKDSEDSNERICGVLMNIAQLKEDLGNFEEAKKYIVESITYAGKAYELNPYRQSTTYSMILNTAGNIFSKNNDEGSVEYYERASAAIQPQYEKYPALFWRTYCQPYINLGIFYTKANNYARASESFEKVIDIAKGSPESNYKNKVLSITLYNYSYIYCITGDYLKAVPLLNESMKYAEKLFKYNKRYGASQYLSSLNNLAYCHNKIGDKLALELYLIGKSTIENLDLCDTPPFISKYADFLYNIAHHYHHVDSNYDDAIRYYLQSYTIYETLNSMDDMLEVIIGLAESYLLKGKLTLASDWINKLNNFEKCESHIGWLHTKGLIALRSGDINTANNCKHKILSLNPSIDTTNMELFNK